MKIVYAEGQTCNQFWIYTNFIADCLEKNEKLAIWIPDITLHHFPQLLKSDFIYFPLYSKWLIKIVGYGRYLKFIRRIFVNRYSIPFFTILFNKFPGINFISANTECKKSNNRIKHLDRIKSIFTPERSLTDEVNHIFNSIRKENTIIIGVHIRHGDYRTFLGGQYFYSVVEYQMLMKKLLTIFSNREVVFFIASNENISPSCFSDINCFNIPNSFSVKDLYGLSICDYIIGPPSTFSGWASFSGHIPIYFIESMKDEFTLDSFINIEDIWL